MKESNTYIIQSAGDKRIIEFEELDQLKKDILWIYDENLGNLPSAFVPHTSFKMKYWEYLTLNGSQWFTEEDKEFYQTRALIILLCFCVEYIDIIAGNQEVFNRSELPTILNYVQNYTPRNEAEQRLVNKVILGLEIAKSLTDEQLKDTDFEHDLLKEFYDNLKEIGDDFIKKYYEDKLNRK